MTGLLDELLNKADKSLAVGDFATARGFLTEAMKLSETFEAKDQRRILVYHQMAHALAGMGEIDQAEALHKKAVEALTKAYGPFHQRVAESLNELASFYFEQERFEEVEQLSRKILNIYEKSFGLRHAEVGIICQQLASVLQELGKYQESENFYRRALSILPESIGPYDARMIATLENFAALLRQQGRDDEADHLTACALGRVSGSLRSITGTNFPEVDKLN